MDVKFEYEYSGDCYFGKIFRPVAKVSFKSILESKWSDIWMVIDSGADFSILPRYVSNVLGISLEKDCVSGITTGVGGEQKIHLCKQKIIVKLGNITKNIPLAFFDSDEVPPLLGRLGFLETFDTCFYKTHVVSFKN